ncbi:MAG: hypothetical protein ACJ798_08295 [Phenylobacterium sp.]
MLRRLVLGALLLGLAACASEPRGREGPGPSGPPRVRLFISPSGEPFRGESGLAAWFAGADANHDGALSREEFEADALRWFRTLDANHDGQLDGIELQAYEHERVPEIGMVDLVEGLGGGPRRTRAVRGGGAAANIPADVGTAQLRAPGAGREGAARYGLLNEAQPVANADSNVDGRVSLAEWKVATARRFERLDRARTGRLVLADLILPRDARKPPPPPRPAPPR